MIKKYSQPIKHTYTYEDPIFENAQIRTYQLNEKLEQEIKQKYTWEKIKKIDNLNSTNDQVHYITIEGENLIGVAEPGYKESSTQSKRKITKALNEFIKQLSEI